MKNSLKTTAFALLVASCVVTTSSDADAFCGFYVNGAGADMFNSATLVVMMREGTRTVLSMENNYEGPPENFALVVPVPVVLKKEDVKTLDKLLFRRVDKLAAPRLVEYWEIDPCFVEEDYDAVDDGVVERSGEVPSDGPGGLGVKIEAKFVVGEYEVVILSAKDAAGLDTWLKKEKYKIPEGAEPVLKPYVTAGMKFFVARVDVSKVKFEDGRARLSPLRFHYDTDTFSLPVRLGLLNSSGTQDLIVHILARGTRYEVANYDNVTIPTNLDVADETRKSFGSFYGKLFDRTLEKNPKAVVTEYSWDANSCDPCPEPPMTEEELHSLGADVVEGSGGFVLTRLHARYGKDTLGEDLIFKKADAIVGGREWGGGDGPGAEKGSSPGSVNNFQARYIIRHPWEGKIDCKDPVRGRWGGPPSGETDKGVEPATDLAFASREGIELASFVMEDVDEIDVKAAKKLTLDGPASDPGAESGGSDDKKDEASSDEPPVKSCSIQSPATDGSTTPLALFALVALLALRRRRRTPPTHP